MRDFAKQRGLDYAARKELRALTPALLTGRDGDDADVVEGRLAEGLDGTLTHHAFVYDRIAERSEDLADEAAETEDRAG